MLCSLPPSSPGRGFPEIEDEENWHGKPLGAKAQASLDTIKPLIKNPGPHGLLPQPIVHDAPVVEFPQVKLSPPPNYKLGEKVCNRVSFVVGSSSHYAEDDSCKAFGNTIASLTIILCPAKFPT